MQAVWDRVSRSAANRDKLPDEAFLRLRGMLFFGPAFMVTANKLTFREDIKQTLTTVAKGPHKPSSCRLSQ